MKIRAAVVSSIESGFDIEELDLAAPAADEILVKVEACGVCHTDVSARAHMQMPAVLGHEGTGKVVARGSAVTDVNVGDTVIMSYGWCGQCGNCASGHAYTCERGVEGSIGGRRFDGSSTIMRGGEAVSGAFFQQSSFASHALCPARDAVVVPADLPAALRAALPCGVMTGAGAVLNMFALAEGETLAVFGTGAVGLSAIMAARLAGARIIVAVDVHAGRLELAQRLGATHMVDARSADVAAQLREICPTGFNYSLETSSNEDAFHAATGCLAMRGTCGLVTVPHGGQPFPFSPFELMVKGARLQGIMLGAATPRSFLPQLIGYYQQGKFPLDALITTYPFHDINTAFGDAKRGSALKPVLLMGD
jgi:aryl-alcohol dehydrogenase